LLDKEADVFEYLKTLSPSAIELEFMSLSTIRPGAIKMNGDLLKMLSKFKIAIKKNQDTDFVQACLNNFLKLHQDTIVEDEELSSLLEDEIIPSVEASF